MPGDRHARALTMLLHGYWRSTASYRVRIALELKGIASRQAGHDLRTGAQRAADYLALNPQGLVPALELDRVVISQSSAILEWLEELHPTPPLLPANANDRAIVRAMAALVGSDIHPLNNLRVLTALRRDLGARDDQVAAWISRWITAGFGALETLIERHGDGFAFGAEPTMADCFLVPQVYSAERFAVDLSPFPRLLAATDAARRLPAFERSHPNIQPDADPA